MWSIHSSEEIEEMICELEGYRLDAASLDETWRAARSEIWGTHHKHVFMGSGKYGNKHGVGIVLDKGWRQAIIGAEYINERAITMSVLVNQQCIKLMSVCFPPLRVCRPPRRKMYRTTEKHTTSENCIPIVGGDFNAEYTHTQ